MTTFGERLISIRKEKGLTQRDLGDIMGKTFTVIGKYERNDINPSLEMIKEFSRALDVSHLYLVDDAGELEIFREKKMIQRLNDILNLSDEDKNHVLHTLDVMLRDAKARQAYTES